MAQLSNVGNYAYPKAVQDVSERIKPSYYQAQKVTVELQPEKGVLGKYVAVEYASIEIEADKLGLDVPFTVEEFATYINSFLVSRVKWVLGEMKDVIVHPNDHVACPALIDAVLKNIGIVLETKQGLTMTPGIGKVKTMPKERMFEVSFFLESIPSYVCGFGFIKDKTGSWEFMSMQLVESVIMSEVDVHPAYSTLAAIVGPVWLGALTAPRIKYGDLNMYEALLWQMTSIKLG